MGSYVLSEGEILVPENEYTGLEAGVKNDGKFTVPASTQSCF